MRRAVTLAFAGVLLLGIALNFLLAPDRPETVDATAAGGAGYGRQSGAADGGVTLAPSGLSPVPPSVSPSASAAAPARWKPRPGLTWQWQLSGKLDRGVNVQVYDLDGFDTAAEDVAKLHAAGRKVICYINAGAYENWRADAAAFPAAVLGNGLEGWEGERWLDIRRWDVLQSLMSARFDRCRSKGFDAVEPDNVDGYDNDSGFPLTAADQLTYNRRIADLAHSKGLAVGLKNDIDQVVALQPYFDFAVNEECMAYDECGVLSAFVRAGKAVFHVEYNREPSAFCGKAKALGLSSMRKRTDLDSWRKAC